MHNIHSDEKKLRTIEDSLPLIKRATVSVLKDCYDFSWIFLDNKMSLPKRCTRLFGSMRDRGMNA